VNKEPLEDARYYLSWLDAILELLEDILAARVRVDVFVVVLQTRQGTGWRLDPAC
jgi:hypothetical protein